MSAAERAGVAHFIVFRRDFRTLAQLAALNRRLHARAHKLGVAPLIALDEEGGFVSQLQHTGLESPGPRVLYEGAGRLVQDTSRWQARALRRLGFNLNFAPVADVDSSARNPVIASRAYSWESAHVQAFVDAHVRAHQAQGVGATLKHFPGHGATLQDSHVALPRLDASPAEMATRELPPFATGVRARAAAVMTAHVRFPQLDARWPATLSPTVLGALRHSLRFNGLVVTDSMDMDGVRRFGDTRAPVLALLAGCDLLLYGMPGNLWRVGFGAVEDAVRRGRIPRERLEQAMDRVDAVARSYPVRPPGVPANFHGRLLEEWKLHSFLLTARHTATRIEAPFARVRLHAHSLRAREAARRLAGLLREAGEKATVEERWERSRELKVGSLPGAPCLHVLVAMGRNHWKPEEAALLERWKRGSIPFGVLPLLSFHPGMDPRAHGSLWCCSPHEDTTLGLRSAALMLAGALES